MLNNGINIDSILVNVRPFKDRDNWYLELTYGIADNNIHKELIIHKAVLSPINYIPRFERENIPFDFSDIDEIVSVSLGYSKLHVLKNSDGEFARTRFIEKK